MKTRELGGTGLQISELALGTWALGGVYYGPVEDEEAISAVRAYIDAGGNHIDTAKSYHKAEPLVGRAIQGYDREKLILASKTYASGSPENFDEVRKHLDIARRDLGTDYVDIYYLHGPPWDYDDMHRVLDQHIELREEGLINYIAASIPGPDVTDEKMGLARQYIASGKVDALQIAYSALRQKADEFFAEAQQAGVGIVARQVLEAGFLTGKYKPGDRFTWPDHRTRYEDDHRDWLLGEVQEKFVPLLPEGYDSPAQMAIQFVLANPHVDTIVLGANKTSQVIRNVAVDKLAPLPEEAVERIKDLFGDMNDDFNPTGELQHVPSPRE